MKKEDLAKNYIRTKSSAFENVIEEAFLAGFEAGVKSSQEQIMIDGVKYIDLNLPSGTKWSECTVNLNFSEAIIHNIPTEEQWNELVRYCKFEKASRYAQCSITSPNGRVIKYYLNSNSPLTWILQNSKMEKEKKAINIESLFNNYSFLQSEEYEFSGFRLPMFFVSME